MKRTIIILMSAFLLSCEKQSFNENSSSEKPAIQEPGLSVKNSRLSFRSVSDVDKFFNDYKKSPAAAKAKLRSLGFDNQAEIHVKAKASASSTSTESPSELITKEDLIEDPIMSEIVNQDMEVEVSDMVYKITPYGTLFTPTEKYDVLEKVVEDFSMDELTMYDEINRKVYENPTTIDGYFTLEGEQVFLYDTYEVVKTREEVSTSTSTPPPVNDIVKVAATSNINSPAIGSGEYSSLPVIKYGKHTFLGKIWSGIFGGANNEVYTANFSDKRRIKVSLYNKNYVVRKVLGLSVKTQKKNWIGWSGTAADEIRLGWDGISFTMEDKVTPANPWDALRKSIEPYRPSKFNYSPDWDPTVRPTPITYEFDLLPNSVTLDLSRGFQQATKLLYDQARRYLYKNVPKNEVSTVAVWLNNELKTPVVIAGPNEISATNKEELKIELASFTDVVFSFSIGAGGKVNWTKTAINSAQATNNASKIVMQFASIYGVARFDSKWMGAVIEKSEN